MGPLDAVGHLIGLLMPALGTGLIASALAKWLWRRALRSTSWLRLAVWPCAAGSVALLAGLVMLGRDGRMLSYAAMVSAAALSLWWAGFGPLRR